LKENGVIERGLNEFVYSLVLNMPLDKLRILPDHLRKKINTPKKASKFAYRSSTDEKRELLSYLDITFFWTFAAIDKITSKEYFGVLKEFQGRSQSEAMSQIIDGQIYVTTDKNHVHLLGRVAQNTQTGAYTKNLELTTLGNYIKKWPKKIKYPEQEESEEILESMMVINRLMYSTIEKSRRSEYLIGVTPEELELLFFFENKRSAYFHFDTLVDSFMGYIPARRMSSIINSLVKKMMIQKHIDWRKREFTITKLGIRSIHKFRELVLKG
jgi:hypothetical protein